MSTLLLQSNTATTPFIFAKPKVPAVMRRSSYTTSCEQRPGDNKRSTTSINNTTSNNSVQRRNLLLGLGGMYAVTAPTLNNTALADQPSPSPSDPSALEWLNNSKHSGHEIKGIVDFVVPDQSEPMRTRRPAHQLSLDREYVAKFEEAVRRMKALPRDDPRNYMQQANIHCAYCNDAYEQVGFPGVPLQVHMSWLFLPWHRYYTYFWERILGKLINDPTFALPYWSWDVLEGMRMPTMYLNRESPLYDDVRDHNHYSALFDFHYKYGDPNPTADQEKAVEVRNYYLLMTMFSNDNLKYAPLFMGKPVKAGQNPKSSEAQFAGALETHHNTVHNWAGQIEKPNWDMGNFHTAARDPMFFAHHGNVDRMWTIYKAKREKPEFTDPDWLNASFIFYDENGQPVKCKVKDCLDPKQLRYTYQDDKLPWEQNDVRKQYLIMRRKATYLEDVKGTRPPAPTRRFRRSLDDSDNDRSPASTPRDQRNLFGGMVASPQRSAPSSSLSEDLQEFGNQPRQLNTTIRALVRRPEGRGSCLLTVENIEFDRQNPVRFDVYLTKAIPTPMGGFTAPPDVGELAGSFVNVTHGLHGDEATAGNNRTMLQLGITELLENLNYLVTPLDTYSDTVLAVSLVPRLGTVTVGGIRIGPLPED